MDLFDSQQDYSFDHEFRPIGGPIGSPDVGGRVDEYLAKNFSFLTRNQWRKRVDSGEVNVNGRGVKPSYRLRLGERCFFFHPMEKEPEVDRNIRVIWQQGGVMGVYKPGNLPMHENGRYRLNTFAQVLNDLCGTEWSAVHRLDKETSGIVVCAATHDLRSKISEALRGRDVFKRYLAIVCGMPQEDEWVETGPIGDLVASQIRIKKWVVPDGLSAETRLVFKEFRSGHSLIEAFPKTGRTNQIRIHLAYNNLPIIGDKLYHPNEDVFLHFWQEGNTEKVQRMAGFRRHLLHAAEISFIHPESKKRVYVECPMAEDMMEYWDQ